MEDNRNTFGGFGMANVRNWILRECLESGDPMNFFLTVQEAVDNIDDVLWDDPDGYWKKVVEEFE